MTTRALPSASLALLACVCAASVACAEPPDVPPLRAEPTRPPSAATPSDARVELQAPIVRVSVRIAESFPPQYFADITSALPDGCARFAQAELRREGDTIFVDVFNTQPASGDVACTMIYGEHETAIALGSEFESGKTYLLDANGTQEAFTAQ